MSTTRSRLIDQEASVQGAALLGQLSRGKSQQTNTSLHVSLGSSSSYDAPAIGKFPSNGDISLISILPGIIRALSSKENKTEQEKAILDCFSGSAPFGHKMKHLLFSQPDTAIRCTNFGSYGHPSIAVTLAQSLYRDFVVDTDADNFMRTELYLRMRDVRRAMADYLGVADHDEVFILPNLAETANSAILSLLFNPMYLKHQANRRAARIRDREQKSEQRPVFRIVMLATAYPMVQECVDYHWNRLHALRAFAPDRTVLPFGVEIVKIPLTLAMVQSLAEFPRRASSCAEADYGDMPALRLPDGTKNIFVDTIVDTVLAGADDQSGGAALIIDQLPCTPGGLIYPVHELSARIKAAAPETTIIIDAAHSIGSLPINFAAERPEFDVWMSNCHKHLVAPKSSAVLWVRSSLHQFFNPATISNMHVGEQSDESCSVSSLAPFRGGTHVRREDKDATISEKLHTSMVWRGTCDFTPFLVLPDLLWFRNQLSSGSGGTGSDARWLAYNRKLAMQGARAMAKVWGTGILLCSDCNDDAAVDKISYCYGSLVNVKAPCSAAELFPAVTHSLLTCSNFLAGVLLDGEAFVRVTAQVYMEVSDFEAAAENLLSSLEFVRKNKSAK